MRVALEENMSVPCREKRSNLLDSRIAHARVQRPDKKPAPSVRMDCRGLLKMPKANLPLGVHHTEDEQTHNSRDHHERLEPEELAQLVGSEERERQRHQPKEEKGEQSGARNTHGLRNRVGNMEVAVTEDCVQHVANQCGAGVELHAEPDDGERCSCEDKVISARQCVS